jgi:hypothetical protein
MSKCSSTIELSIGNNPTTSIPNKDMIQTVKTPMKILVAEDTPIHKNLLKHLLTDQFNIAENDIVFAEDG